MLFLMRLLCSIIVHLHISDAIDLSDVSDDEQPKISVQVEHMEEKENEVIENDNIVVQHSHLKFISKKIHPC
jgi:hypothetical protein